jgi:hypothetical protein
MTSDSAALDPTPSAGARRRGLALMAVSGLLIAAGVACGTDSGDDDPAATDATASASSGASESSSKSPSESPSASESATDDGDPEPSPVIDKAVKGALKDDFPALVPAGVPAGWTVVSATYSPEDGGLWRIDLTDGAGAPVQLVQAKASVKSLVKQWMGAAQPAGEVDLGEYSTGTWSAYTGDSGSAIAKKLSSTAAIIVGTDQDTVVELADQLLTAEDSGSGTGDG